MPHVLERKSLNLLPEEGIVFSEVAQDRQGGRKLAGGQLDGFSISFQLGLLVGHGFFLVECVLRNSLKATAHNILLGDDLSAALGRLVLSQRADTKGSSATCRCSKRCARTTCVVSAG